MSHRFAVSLLVLACGLTLSAVPPAPGQPDQARAIARTFDIVTSAMPSSPAATNGASLPRPVARLASVHHHPDDEVAGEDQNEIENVAVTHLRGTIPAANARKVLSNPSVRTILLTPAGVNSLPTRPWRGTGTGRQSSSRGSEHLAAELLAVLGELGFREAVGYDHRDFTRWSAACLPARFRRCSTTSACHRWRGNCCRGHC